MKKTALLLIILTIISKLIGFSREIVLSYFYGASNTSDAYIIALTIPTVIFAFIASGISTAYIPMYSKIDKNFGEKKANLYTNNLINVLLIICTIIILVGLIFTEQIVKAFASGFEGETLILAINFTRISLLGMYFTLLTHIFSAFLQIKDNYAIPALIGFPMNFCIIISIVISSQKNTMILSYGIVAAAIAQFVFLIPFVVKKGYKYKAIINLKDPHIKTMLQLALPVVLGISVNDINNIVDKTLASQISDGAISALNYASRLNGFVQGIVVTSIATAIYPLISRMAAENNIKGLKKTLSEAIIGVSILVLPATVGAMVLAQPVVELLFGRGAFNEQAVLMTANALFFYSIGMLAFGLRQVLTRPFYAIQDTKTPMINATIGMLLNIILNIVLSRILGISGLALATSISAMVTTCLLFISLRKKIGPLDVKNIAIILIKILFSSLIMGVMAKTSFNILINLISQNLALMIAICIAILIYFTIIYFMKIEDVDIIVNAIKKKMKKATV